MAQIKKDTSLREAILQAAITGQLISDVEGTTETGKELLDRIIEERNKKILADWEEALKKNPKAKKPAPIVASEIDEDEIPFEIPENWCWCRASEICDYIVDCPHSTPKYLEVNSGYCAIDTNCINEFGEITQYRFLSDTAYYERVKRLVPKENDIVYTREGSICRAAILVSRNVCLGQRVMLLRPSFGISSRFLQLYLMSPSTINLLTQKSVGMGVQHINVGDVHNLLIPLPPLTVQNAIVAKLEQVLPLVDAYENAILQKEELKNALPDKVKKAILQEAITGQLTEAWRKSATIKENGKQLLDHIIEERNAKALAEWKEALKKNPKAKKPAAVVVSEIEEENIPFEVPESWCWCRLGDLVPFGQCENAEPNEIEDDAWILDLEDIEKDSGRILQFKTKKEVDSKSTKHIFNKGYVLYSKLRPYLNKCVIAPQDGYCTSEILPLNFGKLINNKFAQTFLMSPYFVDYTDSLSFGVKMPRLGTEDGKKALVPLPPLEEQEEIVKKVEELLPLCK